MYILESGLNLMLWGFQGSGKTTFAAALQDVGKSRIGFAKHGGMSIRLSTKQNNFALNRIVNDIRNGEPTQRPTERNIAYHYDCRFTSASCISSQKLARVSLIDRRGGDFNKLMDDNFIPDDDFVKNLLAEEKAVNGILLLFSLDQFTVAPLQVGVNCFLTRDKVYNFLKSLHEVTRGRNIPIVIAINHIVDGDDPRHIGEVREAIQGWMNNIFIERVPVVYFIDSVAAILGRQPYREKLALPILDLISQFLTMAEPKERGWLHRFAMGDGRKLRNECRKFVLEVINSMGGL